MLKIQIRKSEFAVKTQLEIKNLRLLIGGSSIALYQYKIIMSLQGSNFVFQKSFINLKLKYIIKDLRLSR